LTLLTSTLWQCTSLTLETQSSANQWQKSSGNSQQRTTLLNGQDLIRLCRDKLTGYLIQPNSKKIKILTTKNTRRLKQIWQSNRRNQLKSSSSLLRSITNKISLIWTTTFATMLIWNTKQFGVMTSSMKKSGSLRRTHLISDLSNKALNLCISHFTSLPFLLFSWWQQWDNLSSLLDTCSSWSLGWLMELKYLSSVILSRKKS